MYFYRDPLNVPGKRCHKCQDISGVNHVAFCFRVEANYLSLQFFFALETIPAASLLRVARLAR